MILGEGNEYFSCDTICKVDEDIGVDRGWITIEFLNDIKCFGIPNHILHFKIGVPVMLLRNFDVASDLCNGTRLTTIGLGKNVIKAQILTGPHRGEHVYIPRRVVPSKLDVRLSL